MRYSIIKLLAIQAAIARMNCMLFDGPIPLDDFSRMMRPIRDRFRSQHHLQRAVDLIKRGLIHPGMSTEEISTVIAVDESEC